MTTDSVDLSIAEASPDRADAQADGVTHRLLNRELSWLDFNDRVLSLAAEPGIPAGFTMTEVTLGASNDTDIVITGGLKEGDVIALLDNTPASYDYNPFAQPQNRAEDPGSAPQGQPPQPASGVSR